MKPSRILILLFLASQPLLTGCSHGNCSNLPQRPTAEEHDQNIKQSQPETFNPPAATHSQEAFVTVFKDSGHKQCQPKSGVAIVKFKTQLEKAKINVLEYKTQNDGKMRIQVCGASSGDIHTFLIEKKDLAKAVKLGFEVLK